MSITGQHTAISLLMSLSRCGDCGPVEVIETHISLVFLCGDRVYKMKRAVVLPYVDFSTPALRLASCEKEVALNSRSAPGLYLGVLRITRTPDGAAEFDGEGELVDAVVEMVRFDQARLLDRMALAGELSTTLMSEVAHTIVRFHGDAPVVDVGGAASMATVLDINEAGFTTSHVFAKKQIEAFNASFRSALARHADLLDRRAADGKVRRCHGDLHLRNICLLDGVPRLFDCIEFNDRIGTVDVLYDLAFLLMDLWHRGLPEYANLVANRYLDASDEEDGFSLLPFFMAVRAAVRAHVLATQVEEGAADSAEIVAEAHSYLDLARALLGDVPARLVAIGGYSGSGKSTVAEALAAHLGAPPGARIMESDRIRKAMHGVTPETRLPEKAYRRDVSEMVYRIMALRTEWTLVRGGAVVANGVFERPVDRRRIEEAARAVGVPFRGIWLEVDPVVMRQRVAERRAGPSDATLDVLSHQLRRRPGRLSWDRINGARELSETVAEILAWRQGMTESKEP